jgi:hypothetical protein
VSRDAVGVDPRREVGWRDADAARELVRAQVTPRDGGANRLAGQAAEARDLCHRQELLGDDRTIDLDLVSSLGCRRPGILGVPGLARRVIAAPVLGPPRRRHRVLTVM